MLPNYSASILSVSPFTLLLLLLTAPLTPPRRPRSSNRCRAFGLALLPLLASESDALIHTIDAQVKTRMQLQVGKPVAGAEHYNGMVDCFKKIIAKEG